MLQRENAGPDFDEEPECETHDVKYVIRLKENWKPKVNRLVRGSDFTELARGGRLRYAF